MSQDLIKRTCLLVLLASILHPVPVFGREVEKTETPVRETDLEIEAGLEYVRGTAGFRIRAIPYFSRLDFPTGGVHFFLKSTWSPLPEEKRLVVFFEGALLPSARGTTEDTDWYLSYKWFYSRSDTERRSFRVKAGAGWEIPFRPGLRATTRIGFFFGSDYFRLSNLRHHDLIPALSVPPGDPFVYVPGPVATYRLSCFSLALDLALELDLWPAVRLRLFGSVSPYAVVRGSGNWKLRSYTFQQEGVSYFLAHELTLDVRIDLTPRARLSIGFTRLDWGAMYGEEDGQYALSPEYNYKGAQILEWIRHLQYGLVFGVSLLL